MKFRRLRNFDIIRKGFGFGVNNIYLSATQERYVELIADPKILINDN
jgi:hypothetical protein